jgi:hypothetical protein
VAKRGLANTLEPDTQRQAHQEESCRNQIPGKIEEDRPSPDHDGAEYRHDHNPEPDE